MAANLSLKLGQRAPAAALAGRGKRVVARFANDSAPAGGKARVEFVLPRHVPFGQEVAVVGEVETLGKWDATAAVPLTWTDGDIWTATAEVPVGSAVQYKYIVRLPDNGEVLEWQPCENLVIELPPAAGAATVKDEWEGAHEVVIGGAGAAAAPKAAAAAPAPVAEEAPVAKPAAPKAPAAAAAAPVVEEEAPPAVAAAPKAAAAAPAIGKGPVVAAGATDEEEIEPEAPKTNGKPRGRPSTSSKAPKGRRSA